MYTLFNLPVKLRSDLTPPLPHLVLAAMADFHVQPESVHVEESGVARFQCQIHGLPEPHISWEKDGVPVDTQDQRFTLLPTGVLQITGVRGEDSGRFCCVAHNSAGVKHSAEAVLTVSGGSTFPNVEPSLFLLPPPPLPPWTAS